MFYGEMSAEALISRKYSPITKLLCSIAVEILSLRVRRKDSSLLLAFAMLSLAFCFRSEKLKHSMWKTFALVKNSLSRTSRFAFQKNIRVNHGLKLINTKNPELFSRKPRNEKLIFSITIKLNWSDVRSDKSFTHIILGAARSRPPHNWRKTPTLACLRGSGGALLKFRASQHFFCSGALPPCLCFCSPLARDVFET